MGGSQGCSQLTGLRAVSLQLLTWSGVDSATECPCRVSAFPFCTEMGGTAFTEDACANAELIHSFHGSSSNDISHSLSLSSQEVSCQVG